MNKRRKTAVVVLAFMLLVVGICRNPAQVKAWFGCHACTYPEPTRIESGVIREGADEFQETAYFNWQGMIFADLNGDGTTENIKVAEDFATSGYKLYINGEDYFGNETAYGRLFRTQIVDLNPYSLGYDIVAAAGTDGHGESTMIDNLKVYRIIHYGDDGKCVEMLSEKTLQDLNIDCTKHEPTLRPISENTFGLELYNPWDFGGDLGGYLAELPFVYDEETGECRLDTTRSVNFTAAVYELNRKAQVHATFDEDSKVIGSIAKGEQIKPMSLVEISPEEAAISVMTDDKKVGFIIVEKGMLTSLAGD